uniref:Uncharacterized protein n=1 Tax=Solanum tuberosum TaxID=4113 RepID=M0ZIR6_SOLTU
MDINLQQLCLYLTSPIYHIMSISHFLQYKLAFTVLLLFLNFLGIQANTESKVSRYYNNLFCNFFYVYILNTTQENSLFRFTVILRV